jgi:hypothetical protein
MCFVCCLVRLNKVLSCKIILLCSKLQILNISARHLVVYHCVLTVHWLPNDLNKIISHLSFLFKIASIELDLYIQIVLCETWSLFSSVTAELVLPKAKRSLSMHWFAAKYFLLLKFSLIRFFGIAIYSPRAKVRSPLNFRHLICISFEIT